MTWQVYCLVSGCGPAAPVTSVSTLHFPWPSSSCVACEASIGDDLTMLCVQFAVLQFVLSPVLLWKSFMSTLLANLLFMVALSYYHYLSFLGYSALPFLERTEVFLWPVAAIVLIVPFAVLAGFNPSRFTLNIYFG